MNSLILRGDHDGIATLTINRPEKLNALSKEVFETLDEHLEAIARDTRNVGVVVLRGAQRNFSAGYEMSEVLEYVKAGRQTSLPLGSHQHFPREPTAAGDFGGRRTLLDWRTGVGARRGSHRRERIGAVLRRIRPLGPDADLGPHSALATPDRHGQGKRDDAHLAQLLRPGRRRPCTWPTSASPTSISRRS